MGFYPPADGTILVSGTDINQLDPTDLRRNVIHVPQDTQLLSGTIRENIVMGFPQADDETVLRAAELSGLSEFVNQHPDGFDMQVGERGGLLSGGQRSAVVLARAFIQEAPILLLDEPTSAMDNTSENRFRTHLQQFASDKTMILATHKTTMLALVERVIVLNEGQIVADGKRDDVLSALAGGQAR